jgi:hypothetical protein
MDLTAFPVERAVDGRYVGRLPFFDDPEAGIPLDRFVLADHQIPAHAAGAGDLTATGTRPDPVRPSPGSPSA